MSFAETWIVNVDDDLPQGHDVADFADEGRSPEWVREWMTVRLVKVHPLSDSTHARIAAAARRVGLSLGGAETEIVMLAARGKAGLVELAAEVKATAPAREKQVLRAAWLVADHEEVGSNPWP